MGYQLIETEQRGRVGIITMNRPERLNAWNARMADEMQEQIGRWNDDPAIGAIIVTGAGRAFCAGADMGDWSKQIAQMESGETAPPPAVPRVTESWPELAVRSKPLIAAINGHAVGVGLTMALPFDVRIASERAKFSMRMVRVGTLPELASTNILSAIVGMTHALELMLSGRIIDAAEADRIGLVSRVVPHGELMERALEVGSEIAFNPTESLLAIKRLAWTHRTTGDLAAVIADEEAERAVARSRPAWKEAVTAFREKREPDFHRG